MDAEPFDLISETKIHRPDAIADAVGQRKCRTNLVGPAGRLFLVAADHTARGVSGEMLFRIDPDDAATVATIAARAHAVDDMHRVLSASTLSDGDVASAVDTVVGLL